MIYTNIIGFIISLTGIWNQLAVDGTGGFQLAIFLNVIPFERDMIIFQTWYILNGHQDLRTVWELAWLDIWRGSHLGFWMEKKWHFVGGMSHFKGYEQFSMQTIFGPMSSYIYLPPVFEIINHFQSPININSTILFHVNG